MLVLSRKLEQSIQIGDDVTITILSVKGNTVRLGISAPEHVRVARTELAQKSNPQSSSGSAKPAKSLPRGMEVIEVQSRPNAPIKLERSNTLSIGEAPAAPKGQIPSTPQPPLYSRMIMFADDQYETHHFRIRMDETPAHDVSQS
ncbi:MAG: carbon storage regulator CsrA [Planctomycetaceae bacterium]|nr:carbon storage regulator CsrA [Planctomycetaceae bacterium]